MSQGDSIVSSSQLRKWIILNRKPGPDLEPKQSSQILLSIHHFYGPARHYVGNTWKWTGNSIKFCFALTVICPDRFVAIVVFGCLRREYVGCKIPLLRQWSSFNFPSRRVRLLWPGAGDAVSPSCRGVILKIIFVVTWKCEARRAVTEVNLVQMD